MRPLDGIRVLDLTRVLSGPYCTMLLGDLGAEVIKVERPSEGDDTRAFAPPFQGDQAAYFLSINRNKKSITLDMKSERGKEILWRLVELSDVLVENFRPGAMERLGFGYETVRARRPAMVYCSISGFGDSGPQKDRARALRAAAISGFEDARLSLSDRGQAKNNDRRMRRMVRRFAHAHGSAENAKSPREEAQALVLMMKVGWLTGAGPSAKAKNLLIRSM
jgi:CoA-transferase family III